MSGLHLLGRRDQSESAIRAALIAIAVGFVFLSVLTAGGFLAYRRRRNQNNCRHHHRHHQRRSCHRRTRSEPAVDCRDDPCAVDNNNNNNNHNPEDDNGDDGGSHGPGRAIGNPDPEAGAWDLRRARGGAVSWPWRAGAGRDSPSLPLPLPVASWDERDLAKLFDPDSSSSSSSSSEAEAETGEKQDQEEEGEEEGEGEEGTMFSPASGDISLARISTARTVLITPVVLRHGEVPPPRARGINFSCPQRSSRRSGGADRPPVVAGGEEVRGS